MDGHRDMLHDVERNRLYERAIQTAIEELQQRNGRSVEVIDIGTGSGLLGCIACRAGANVTAFGWCQLSRRQQDVWQKTTS